MASSGHRGRTLFDELKEMGQFEESEEIDFARALDALARALTRLLVVGRAQSQP